ncbi:HTH_Tnp_Tc3_2 domain-containing protein [Trichonephila clavipes]|nr:HTH_Tnp_Tc3_2 domain-containing protein [Trichonephila clavipes]
MPLRRNRRQYEQLTDFDRGRNRPQRAGWSNRRIGRHLGRSEMVVARCWQQWITKVECTVAEVPSRETIRRRLTEVGLRSRCPLRRLPLTPHHRQCRLDFCRPRATWSVTDWRRVIFSDESRFSLSDDDHRTRVWRRTGQRSEFIVERHTAISQGVTVWGNFLGHTIIFTGPSRHFDSYFNADCATHAIKSIYQQDNARPHNARLSQQCLQGYDVLWPASSPDLSPIEYVARWEGNCSRPEIQEN